MFKAKLYFNVPPKSVSRSHQNHPWSSLPKDHSFTAYCAYNTQLYIVRTHAILPCRIFGPCLSVRAPLSPDRGLPLSANCVLHVWPEIILGLICCDYDNEWNLNDKIPYLDSDNILYTTCFDSVHKLNTKRNKWLTHNCYPVSTVNKYGCCCSSFTCTFNGHQRHDSMRFETRWCNYFGYSNIHGRFYNLQRYLELRYRRRTQDVSILTIAQEQIRFFCQQSSII